MAFTTIEQRVAAVRRFSRFYTPLIGLLADGYLDSRFSLTEVRVLYEIAQNPGTTSAQLRRTLGVDRGYLSRMLRRFRHLGLLQRTASAADGRQQLLSLTDEGHATFDRLDRRAHDEVAAILARHTTADQRRVVRAMDTIESVLSGPAGSRTTYRLRPPRAGDLGWVVMRHGVIYGAEYGWDQAFEALVAEIVAAFGRDHDPHRERCWIADLGGQNVGSIFCVANSATVAQLRLLMVEPYARGLGIGARLVEECIDFARSAGYERMVLWTNDVLVSARRIYEAFGFRLVAQERHHSFGHDLVGQNWELELLKRATVTQPR